jgi:hypothetical protein
VFIGLLHRSFNLHLEELKVNIAKKPRNDLRALRAAPQSTVELLPGLASTSPRWPSGMTSPLPSAESAGVSRDPPKTAYRRQAFGNLQHCPMLFVLYATQFAWIPALIRTKQSHGSGHDITLSDRFLFSKRQSGRFVFGPLLQSYDDVAREMEVQGLTAFANYKCV